MDLILLKNIATMPYLFDTHIRILGDVDRGCGGGYSSVNVTE